MGLPKGVVLSFCLLACWGFLCFVVVLFWVFFVLLLFCFAFKRNIILLYRPPLEAITTLGGGLVVGALPGHFWYCVFVKQPLKSLHAKLT